MSRIKGQMGGVLSFYVVNNCGNICKAAGYNFFRVLESFNKRSGAQSSCEDHCGIFNWGLR